MATLFSSKVGKRKLSEPVDAPVKKAKSISEDRDSEETRDSMTLEEVSPPSEEGPKTFKDLGLSNWIANACKSMGFRSPFPVQKQCIPAILQGRDVLGCAETGSGKTAAFALPMLHRLSEDPYGIFGVVLTPTRELAIQISEQFAVLGASINLKHSLVIGGMSMVSCKFQFTNFCFGSFVSSVDLVDAW